MKHFPLVRRLLDRRGVQVRKDGRDFAEICPKMFRIHGEERVSSERGPNSRFDRVTRYAQQAARNQRNLVTRNFYCSRSTKLTSQILVAFNASAQRFEVKD